MSYVFKFNLLPSYLIIRHLFWRQDCWAPCAVIGPQIRRGFKPAIKKKNVSNENNCKLCNKSSEKRKISCLQLFFGSGAGSVCAWASWIRSRNYLYRSGSFHQLAKKINKNLSLLFSDFFMTFYL